VNGFAPLNWIATPDPDLGSLVFGIVVLIVLMFVIVPILLFGIELVIAGCLIAGTVIGRLLFGRPWQIEARTVGQPASPRVLDWDVTGWRQSRALVRDISAEIAAGRDPRPVVVRIER
jgi:hypothetical protein